MGTRDQNQHLSLNAWTRILFFHGNKNERTVWKFYPFSNDVLCILATIRLQGKEARVCCVNLSNPNNMDKH